MRLQETLSKGGLYIGVGAHLTAYGCKVAKDNGFEVYYFDAKTDLINHYAKTLGHDKSDRAKE